MNSNKTGATIAALLAIILFVIAVVYFTTPAGTLPSFFPGHAVGSVHKHAKHGILALGLAIVLALVAWFQSGPKAPAASR